jgi:hypothetical protein
MEAGDARRDVTVRLLWSAQIEVGAIEPIRDRMDGRGGDQWDWYIVPAGAFDQYFHNGQHAWEGGVGARKMCSLPAAPLGKSQVEGELWFVGGERAFQNLEWKALDVGEGMAEGAIREWLDVDLASAGTWKVQERALSWARAGSVPALEKRCRAAALVDSEEKAAKLARVGMDVVWGLKRVFKREVWNRRGVTEEDGGSTEPDTPPVMVVRGKDATRGLYRLPCTTKVCKKNADEGSKA